MTYVRTPGGCSCSFQRSHPEHHERFVQIESEGIYGATELVALALTWDELDYSDYPVIAPDQWPSFVAAHQWHDAEAVGELVDVALDCLRRGRRGVARAA